MNKRTRLFQLNNSLKRTQILIKTNFKLEIITKLSQIQRTKLPCFKTTSTWKPSPIYGNSVHWSKKIIFLSFILYEIQIQKITYPSTHHFTYYMFYRRSHIFLFKHFIVCDVWCLDCLKVSLEYSSQGSITFIEIFNFHKIRAL